MEIRFSRHAKRRARLYGISETTVREILMNAKLKPGEHVIVRDVAGIKFPLKIVVTVENDMATVITNYPLKKGRKK